MIKVGDGPVHALTLRLPADLRFSYFFERIEGSGSSERVDDPWNRRLKSRDERLQGPVAVLPEAEELPVLERSAERIGQIETATRSGRLSAKPPAPAVEELMISSAALGEQRRVWVSRPAGELAADLPVVIVFDGSAGHCAPAVRDVLAGEGQIPPVVVVLVDQLGTRDRDLTGYEPFSQFLVAELLPLLRERYGVSARPSDVVLSGSSFGGLCAGWTALQHPDVFGGAIMQSPSCWYHPDLSGREALAGGLVSAPTPLLIKAFSESPPAPIRIFHEVGKLEFGPPPAQVWQVHGNRWLHRVLVSKGYDLSYREFAGGHDAAWWRGTWAEGIEWHFGQGP